MSMPFMANGYTTPVKEGCEHCKKLKEENERLLKRIRDLIHPRDYSLTQEQKEELADFYGPDFAASQLKDTK